MSKRRLTVEAKLEATADECWVTCRVGHRKYRTHWKYNGGLWELQSGTDVLELRVEDWVKELLESLEAGAWKLTEEAVESC